MRTTRAAGDGARRLGVAVLASASTLALCAACGSTGSTIGQDFSSSPSKAGSHTLTVDRVGFAWGNGQSATDQTTLWNGMALITNHSTGDMADNVAVHVSARGSAGQVVGTGSALISVIRPGQQVGVATALSGITAPPTRLAVQVASGTWLPDPTPKATILGKNVHLQQPQQYDPSDYTASGDLVSTYTSNLSYVYVSAVCFDKTGHIVGGGCQYVQRLPGNGTAGASVTVYASNPATCQFYGDP
jgi:hypothetical protein